MGWLQNGTRPSRQLLTRDRSNNLRDLSQLVHVSVDTRASLPDERRRVRLKSRCAGMTSTGGQAPTVGFNLDEVPVTPAAQSDNGKVWISTGFH